MTRLTYAIMVSMALMAPQADAGDACDCRFEVAGAQGSSLAVTRATRQATAGACDFAVRLRVADPERCTGTRAIVRGIGAHSGQVAWSESWEQVSVRAGGTKTRRRLLRARVRGAEGGSGRARLALRCAPRLSLAGCADVLAESTYCFLGGGRDLQLVGLDSGTACEDIGEPGPPLLKPSVNLAVWSGQAYTCSAGSAAGSFVASPVEGGPERRLAGPCAAVATDGESLFVLPREGFDGPAEGGRAHQHLLSSPGGALLTTIRAYDLPEVVPGGPYRVAFDLGTVPADSPCFGLTVTAMAASNGVVYAAGCHPDATGCTPAPRICAFDTTTGATLPPIELQQFDGPINGMSALDGARLLVLSDDQTALPPTGYVPQDSGGSPQRVPIGPPDRIHIFDAATGARLDTRSLGTSLSRGLSCVANAG